MSAIKLATRYAKSLLDFAVEKGTLDQVYQDQLFLKKVINESKDFAAMLSSPLIHPDKKMKVLQLAIGTKVSELTMMFLQLLVKKNREVYLKEVIDSFLIQYDEYMHITQVKLTAANPLDKAEIDRLLNKLKQQANLETINLTTEIDERLIGGFVLQYGDKQVDASIARQMNILKKGLESNEYLKKLR